MTTLARLGLCELAFAAMLGWLVAASRADPHALEKIGIVSPKRVLQCHLDYIMMGLILISVSVVAPDLNGVIEAALIFGTIVNPGIFLVLAFGDGVMKSKAFMPVMLLSFTAMSGGLVATAITA